MNLNFDYSGFTKLKEWWKIVRENFQSIQSEYNECVQKTDETLGALDEALGTEKTERKEETTAIKTRVSALETGKLDKNTYASASTAGVIKLLSSGSGTNRSGIVVGTDGTAYINSRSDRGISRDGSGQLGINPATAEEVAAGEESYKPVTPATLKPYIEAIYSTPAAYPKPGKAVYVGTWQGDKSVWRLAVDYTVSDLDISEGYTQDAAAKLGEYFVSAPAPALNIGGYIEYTYEGAAYYVGMSRVWQYDVSLNEYVKSGAVAHLMYDFVAEKSDFKDGVADN